VVYCHASAFGSTGPRAAFPGNDALMQAVTGFERAIGGDGNDPVAATWIPIDMAGGWVAAVGMLAGLYARARGGAGQVVETSLLGAGVLLHSGVFYRDGALVRGPALDASQTGYGPGYRIYEGGDGQWLALVVPSLDAWQRLASLLPPRAELPLRVESPAGTVLSAGTVLPEQYVPLRGGALDAVARSAEAALEAAFASGAAADWVRRLTDAGLLAELIEPLDRDGFRRKILDDPVNRELGRVASYETTDWGWFEQIGPLVRTGPSVGASPRLMLPGAGEHTVTVLAELGFPAAAIQDLLDAKVARQLAELRRGRPQGKARQVDAAG
jgi:crotonobetainyl-CoA:carnitine CoA-transferase CaiB-like acyl-CoA transferase